MRGLICAACFTLVLAPVVFAQSAPDKSAVRQLLTEQEDAWNRHDLEGFMRGYWKSPDLTFFSSNGITKGWDATLQRYRTRYQSEGREMGKLEFSDLNIQMLGPEAAFVRGRWHLKFSDGKDAGGVYTLIIRKFSEGWRIVHDHTS